MTPKHLRGHTRFDRKLLGILSFCAWSCLKDEIQRLLGRDDVLPDMIATIQTHGEFDPSSLSWCDAPLAILPEHHSASVAHLNVTSLRKATTSS